MGVEPEIVPRVPGALQHEVLLCRPGTPVALFCIQKATGTPRLRCSTIAREDARKTRLWCCAARGERG